MEFQIAESMCDIGHYLPLAQAADEAGFGCFGLGDSVLYPESAVGSYPYNDDGTQATRRRQQDSSNRTFGLVHRPMTPGPLSPTDAVAPGGNVITQPLLR